MKKKILLWILGIIGVMIIGGGVYAYNVYSKVSKTLDEVHKPLKRDKDSNSSETAKISKSEPVSILL
ncbi:TPA: LytR family transcriptional regulator, partial [Streptococcus agalactiae]